MTDVQGSTETVTAEYERLFKVLTSAEGQVNPYPVYAEMRRLAPVFLDLSDSSAILMRYDDIQSIIRNPALGAQSPAWMDRVRPDWREHPGLVATHESFVFRDPPDHTRLRRHVSGDFSPAKVRKWQDYITGVTTQVLDLIEDGGTDGRKGYDGICGCVRGNCCRLCGGGAPPCPKPPHVSQAVETPERQEKYIGDDASSSGSGCAGERMGALPAAHGEIARGGGDDVDHGQAFRRGERDIHQADEPETGAVG